MRDIDRSDIFDDAVAEIARLGQRIAEVEKERPTLPPKRRYEMGWWLYGARKHIWRLSEVVRAQARDEHVFVIHESRGRDHCGLCSCGARIPGELHVDYTLADFATQDGHVPSSRTGE